MILTNHKHLKNSSGILKKIIGQRAILFFSLVLLHACSLPSTLPLLSASYPEALLNGEVLLGDAAGTLELLQHEILELDEDMIEFLENHVPKSG